MTEPTVLVVDDEPGLASLYVAWLDGAYDVRSATDGAAALAAVRDGVDAVMLDRQMPGCSGDEVLETLRQKGDRTPVAMVTAKSPGADALALPFDDYLVKPISQAEFARSVERLLTVGTYDRTHRCCARLGRKLALAQSFWTPAERRDRRVYSRVQRAFAELAGRVDRPVDELLGFADGDDTVQFERAVELGGSS